MATFNKKFGKKQKQGQEQEQVGREYNTIDLLRAARDSQSTKGAARDALVAIIIRIGLDPDYKCWPSYELLSHDTMRSVSTMKQAVKELTEMGLVTRRRQFNSSNVYVMNAHLLMQQAETRRAEVAELKRRKMLGLKANEEPGLQEAPEIQASTTRTVPKPALDDNRNPIKPRHVVVGREVIQILVDTGELYLDADDLAVVGDLEVSADEGSFAGHQIGVDSRWESSDNWAPGVKCSTCTGSGYVCYSAVDERRNMLTLVSDKQCESCGIWKKPAPVEAKAAAAQAVDDYADLDL
jgi:DNA-binding transcriptional ArsR family regulator